MSTTPGGTVLHISIEPELNFSLTELARLAGLSVPAYVRMIAKNHVRTHRPAAEPVVEVHPKANPCDTL